MQDKFDESFLKSFKSRAGTYIELFINPSIQELDDSANSVHQEFGVRIVRGILFNNKFITWVPATVMHVNIEEFISHNEELLLLLNTDREIFLSKAVPIEILGFRKILITTTYSVLYDIFGVKPFYRNPVELQNYVLNHSEIKRLEKNKGHKLSVSVSESNKFLVQTNLKSDIKINGMVIKSGSKIFKEFTIGNWEKSGLSQRNKFFNQERHQYISKVDYAGLTYNMKTQNIRIYFKVFPTFEGGTKPVVTINQNGKPVKAKLNSKGNVSGLPFYYFYTAQIEFKDVGEWIVNKEDWIELPSRTKVSLVKDMVDGSEVRFLSNDPSFLYQGVWHNLDKSDSSIIPFPKNIPDKGIWAKKHGNSGFFLTKHFPDVFATLRKNYLKISQDITAEMNRVKSV